MKVCGGAIFKIHANMFLSVIQFHFSLACLAIVVNDCSGSSYGLNNSSPTTMPQGRLQWRLLYYLIVI